uniref:Uncharacterized protein n=1 Tax=Amphimedon queenslandica TaxID=400682 RepID=A0A1X7UGV8_AMPQE
MVIFEASVKPIIERFELSIHETAGGTPVGAALPVSGTSVTTGVATGPGGPTGRDTDGGEVGGVVGVPGVPGGPASLPASPAEPGAPGLPSSP